MMSEEDSLIRRVIVWKMMGIDLGSVGSVEIIENENNVNGGDKMKRKVRKSEDPITTKLKVVVDDDAVQSMDDITVAFLGGLETDRIEYDTSSGFVLTSSHPKTRKNLEWELGRVSKTLVKARQIWMEKLAEFSGKNYFNFDKMVPDSDEWLLWRLDAERKIKSKGGKKWYEFLNDLNNELVSAGIASKGMGPYEGQRNIFEEGLLIVSKPGLGKTTLVSSIASKDRMPIVHLSLATLTVEEIVTSIPDKERHTVETFITESMSRLEKNGAGIVFIDEINRPNSTRLLNILMSLLPAGTLGGRRINAFFYVIGAANPPLSDEDRDFMSNFSGAISDRFSIYLYKPEKEEIEDIMEEILNGVEVKMDDLAYLISDPLLETITLRFVSEVAQLINKSFEDPKNSKNSAVIESEVESLFVNLINRTVVKLKAAQNRITGVKISVPNGFIENLVGILKGISAQIIEFIKKGEDVISSIEAAKSLKKYRHTLAGYGPKERARFVKEKLDGKKRRDPLSIIFELVNNPATIKSNLTNLVLISVRLHGDMAALRNGESSLLEDSDFTDTMKLYLETVKSLSGELSNVIEKEFGEGARVMSKIPRLIRGRVENLYEYVKNHV